MSKPSKIKIQQIIKLQKGKPPLEMPYFDIGALPYLNPEYLRGRLITEFAKVGSDTVIVYSGDILILWDGSNAGEIFRAKHGILSSTMCKILIDESLNIDYVFYALKNSEFTLKSQTSGSGIPHVDKEIFFNISLYKFQPDEQTQIATILSTIDQAIEQTEAIIAKQQRIKTGLMQDLLTCGIDEQGNIRSEATHEFKDSPLGRIPVEWDVKAIAELVANVDPAMRSGPFGSALLKEDLSESGIPLLGIDNVYPERFVDSYKRFVPPDKAKQLKRYLVREGDLMITIMGTVGRSCVVPDSTGEALSSKHVYTITLDQSVYLPYLACLQINYSPWVLEHFRQGEQGGIMEAINIDVLKSTRLPIIPMDEANNIKDILETIGQRIEKEKRKKRKLKRQKIGLMQDLLTGKVRVTDLLNQQPIQH